MKCDRCEDYIDRSESRKIVIGDYIYRVCNICRKEVKKEMQADGGHGQNEPPASYIQAHRKYKKVMNGCER